MTLSLNIQTSIIKYRKNKDFSVSQTSKKIGNKKNDKICMQKM
jgi:hypothetical protein